MFAQAPGAPGESHVGPWAPGWRGAVQRWLWRYRTPAVALALVLFAIAAVISSVSGAASNRHLAASNGALRDQVERLEATADCRATLANRVNVLQERRTAALADGLAAFADNDDARLAEQTALIHALAPQVAQALQDQENQGTLCAGRPPGR